MWIEMGLEDRKQCNVLNGKTSGWGRVLSNELQGSILGPILFLVFIKNLDVQVELLTVVRKLADDTNLRQVTRTGKDQQLLHSNLDRLTTWTKTFGMTFKVKQKAWSCTMDSRIHGTTTT
jgi:hypothetical protein